MNEVNTNLGRINFIQGETIKQSAAFYDWVPVVKFLDPSFKCTDTNQFLELQSQQQNKSFKFWLDRLVYLEVPYVLAKGMMKQTKIDFLKLQKIKDKSTNFLNDGRIKRYTLPRQTAFGLFVKPF